MLDSLTASFAPARQDSQWVFYFLWLSYSNSFGSYWWDFWRFALSPIASFDVNAREALYNPHQAAIDVKKPAELVLCGLSELHWPAESEYYFQPNVFIVDLPIQLSFVYLSVYQWWFVAILSVVKRNCFWIDHIRKNFFTENCSHWSLAIIYL